jgi:septal ring factor EnvC (AmiA/AmiB activator)
MKSALLLVVSVLLARPCLAQWAVFDIANLQQSATNYAAMMQQIGKQAEQISNQVQQIQQMEDQLKRLGNLADIKAVIGLPQLQVDMNLPTRIRVWAETVAHANGTAIFGDTRAGIYFPVAPEFSDFDGAAVARSPEYYKPAQEIASTVDEFKDVQSDVYARRAELKRAITQTTEALRLAETDAETKKLTAVLQAQYAQLAALDSEVSLTGTEVQVRVAESTAMANAQHEADAEARRSLAHQEAEKVTATFKPLYQSVLLYLKEQPFRP